MQKLLCLFLLFFCCYGLPGEQRFDWSTVLQVPPGAGQTEGNQILHFKAKNKPYSENQEAVQFVQRYLSQATRLTSDAEVLKYASDSVKIKGLFVELGVCTGRTINFLGALNPHTTIYGFDSFEGLPEDWLRKDIVITKGTFGFKDPNTLPPVLHNVTLIKGLFQDTLPKFVQEHREPIALLHVDSDLYSSAKAAFDILGDRIVPGTIIVFDELYNYPGYEQHEFKALQEFLAKRKLNVRYLAYNAYHEQVAVEIQ
jgi:hypothetical protein